MNRSCWRLAAVLSRFLESGERDAVLGDLTERAAGGMRALIDVLGLVVRRQAALWKTSGPWLALAAVVGPASAMLSLTCFALWRSYDLYFWIGRNYGEIDPTVLQETHLTLLHGIVLMLRGSVVLACLAWTAGFVIGALSHRAVGVTGSLFSALMLLGGIHLAMVPRILQTLVLALSLVGMQLGLRPSTRPLLRSLLWAAAIVTALVGHQSWLWWPVHRLSRMQIVVLVRYWPIVYLVADATRRRWRATAVIV